MSVIDLVILLVIAGLCGRSARALRGTAVPAGLARLRSESRDLRWIEQSHAVRAVEYEGGDEADVEGLHSAGQIAWGRHSSGALIAAPVPRWTLMELMDTIRNRRAVRDYTDTPIDRTTIERVINAAILAPSAMNLQPWAFAAVANRGRIDEYAGRDGKFRFPAG